MFKMLFIIDSIQHACIIAYSMPASIIETFHSFNLRFSISTVEFEHYSTVIFHEYSIEVITVTGHVDDHTRTMLSTETNRDIRSEIVNIKYVEV